MVLRYMSYSAFIRGYMNPGGLQETYPSQTDRKLAGNCHIQRMQRAFPVLIEPDAKSQMKTVNARFNSVLGLRALLRDGHGWWS